MNVGRAIRWFRKRRGASQTNVAERADCSVSYLSMLENNKRDPTLSTITKIADALCVPVGALFVLASDEIELGKIDQALATKLKRAAEASMPTAINLSGSFATRRAVINKAQREGRLYGKR